MVGEDLHQKGRTMEVVVPRFQRMNDSEKFMVVDVIMVLGRGEGLREIGARVPVSIGIGLEEDSTRCMFRRVGGYGERGREIGEVKDRF